jgi:membrane complex biogenesis BtpA family protein
MFGNENDRPYEFEVDTASVATMAALIGELRGEIAVPFGVNVLWDPMSTMALAAATGASFVREILTGTYASDMGPWNPDAGAALRYRDRLGRRDLAVLYNISAEFAYSLDRRSLADRARSAVFSSIPDAILVSGAITGEAADMSDLAAVKAALPAVPVLANTGVRHETVADVLAVADGCIVGSSLKVDGDTWNPVDPARAADFMRRARAARGERP